MCHYDIAICHRCNVVTKIELTDRCPGGVFHFYFWVGARTQVIYYTCRWCSRLIPP